MLAIRVLCRRMHTPFPKAWKPTINEDRPKVYVPLIVNRADSVMLINAYSATLQLRDESLLLNSPGLVTVDFTPKTTLSDGVKRSLDVKQRKFITVFSDEFVRFWDLQASAPIVRETKDSVKQLTLSRSGNQACLRLTVQARGESECVTREETLRLEEHWLVQEYIKYAIPYICGWFVMGDISIVEQHLVTNLDSIDSPAHGHKDHTCDDHCDHKH